MIDYHAQLVAALGTVLPTHYEMTLTAGTATPCLSYMELNNYVDVAADAAEYSRLSYQIKVWGNDLAELQRYAVQVDAALRPLGWRRTGSRELYDHNSTMIQKILTYEALALEYFTTEV